MSNECWSRSHKRTKKQAEAPNDAENGFAQWGGYMQAKKAKLEEQYEETTRKETEKLSNIFQGIAIFVNGLTNPNATELKRLMAAHGGTFHLYQNTTTTHIIASNLPNVKINKLGPVPIVKPAWITESLSLSKLLDFRPYLLYTNQSVSQPKLSFAKTASDPKFLEEFYGNSRLHLIATLGAEFKQLITDLRTNSKPTFPGLDKLPKNKTKLSEKVIMHIDMDCFFVSVGLRSRPELRGRPVAVTHARNPTKEATFSERVLNSENGTSSLSEIACCSYEARAFGVKNGMFLGAASKLCPDLHPIPYDFDGYKQVSKLLYSTIASFTLNIEAVSCDEMYVDCTEILEKTGLEIAEWAEFIRNEIHSVTDCTCSTGFGANRLQARMATKKAKPNGYYALKSEEIDDFFREIDLKDLPGVGRATLDKLDHLGLKKCGDVVDAPLYLLKKDKLDGLVEQCKGIDRKALVYEHERKSVSAEVNYGIRFGNVGEMEAFLDSLAKEAWNRLGEAKMRAKCVTVKVMVRADDAPIETAKFLGHGVCDSFSKSVSFGACIQSVEKLQREVRGLYARLAVDFRELRGMGVQLSKLEKAQKAEPNAVLATFLQKPSKSPKKAKAVSDLFKKSKKQPFEPSKKIDMSVLNELPPEIRLEVMQEYGLDEIERPTIVENPPEIEIVKEKESFFAGLNWEQLKRVLYEWLASETCPNGVDINMLAKYFENLAIQRDISFLQVACNFLGRNVEERGCGWHRGYYTILDSVQKGMVARYGSVLCVKKRLECRKCHC